VDSSSRDPTKTPSLRFVPYLVLGVLGVLLSGYRAFTLAPYRDESATMIVCRAPFDQWWPLLVARGGYLHQSLTFMPPAYYLLIRSLFHLFGAHLLIPRLLSAVGHALTTVFIYRIFEDKGWRKSGSVAATLVLLHPVLLWHACDARWYSLMVGLHAVSVCLLLAPSLEKGVWLWVPITAFPFYLHHYGIILIVLEALFLFIRRRQMRIYLLPLFAALIPAFVMLHRAMEASSAKGTLPWAPMEFTRMILATVSFLGGFLPVDLTSTVSADVTFAVGVAIPLFCTAVTLVDRSTQLACLGGATYLYFIGLPLVHWWRNVFYAPRFAIVGVVFCLAWLALCLARIARGRLLYPVGVVIGIYMLALDWRLPMSGATGPQRPVTQQHARQVLSLPGILVFDPWVAAVSFVSLTTDDTSGRCLLSFDDTMPLLGREILGRLGTPYPLSTTWDRFRTAFVAGRPFTAVMERYVDRPDERTWFCQHYDPNEGARDFTITRLWKEHPFLVFFRYEPRNDRQRQTPTAGP